MGKPVGVRPMPCRDTAFASTVASTVRAPRHGEHGRRQHGGLHRLGTISDDLVILYFILYNTSNTYILVIVQLRFQVLQAL
jgi:hypothetical protein